MLTERVKQNSVLANVILTTSRNLRESGQTIQFRKMAAGFGKIIFAQMAMEELGYAAGRKLPIGQYGKKSTVLSRKVWFSITNAETAPALTQIIFAQCQSGITTILGKLCGRFLRGGVFWTHLLSITDSVREAYAQPDFFVEAKHAPAKQEAFL